jgi:hypothetical protein
MLLYCDYTHYTVTILCLNLASQPAHVCASPAPVYYHRMHLLRMRPRSHIRVPELVTLISHARKRLRVRLREVDILATCNAYLMVAREVYPSYGPLEGARTVLRPNNVSHPPPPSFPFLPPRFFSVSLYLSSCSFSIDLRSDVVRPDKITLASLASRVLPPR